LIETWRICAPAVVAVVRLALAVTRDEVLCPLAECLAEACAGLAAVWVVFDEVEWVAA
jgi:hypothetical protein